METNVNPNGLSPRQEKLLNILTGNSNIQAAAKAAGVGRTTVHRWLQEPSFREELSRRRNTMMEETLGSLKSCTAKASEQLIRLLDSENEWVCRQVCKDILGYALRVREVEAIEARLEAIEKAIEMNNPNQRRN